MSHEEPRQQYPRVSICWLAQMTLTVANVASKNGGVSVKGTSAYAGDDAVPALVRDAVAAAEKMGFEESCLPPHGRLLALLAAGLGPGVIGETGTGCGVGLAWLAGAAHPAARLVSIDRDEARVATVRELFAKRETGPPVEVRHGDWSELVTDGPFDLLVLDGGGHGKTGGVVDVDEWLRPRGVVVIDDFTPFDTWPPRHGSDLDHARLHWLRHPRLLASEIQLTSTVSVVVARYLGPNTSRDDG